MNGYETMSENYKILMQRGEIEKEAAEKAIRAFLVRAVTSAGLDDDTIDQIMQQLRYIFDGQTAKEVLEAHLA
jgi:SOS response regulatory protein OraA/RecX